MAHVGVEIESELEKYEGKTVAETQTIRERMLSMILDGKPRYAAPQPTKVVTPSDA